MNSLVKISLSFILLVFFSTTMTITKADASLIFYDITNIGGNSWEYEYTVENDSLSSNIRSFTVLFDYGPNVGPLYENLSVSSPLAGWNEVALDPEVILGFPADGLFDAFTFGSGIANGDQLSGFSLTFDYNGVGTPGAQAFSINDPDTFAEISRGQTQLFQVGVPPNDPPQANPIPEPATMLLMLAGLAGGGWRYRKMNVNA